jgi:hypothetical protein
MQATVAQGRLRWIVCSVFAVAYFALAAALAYLSPRFSWESVGFVGFAVANLIHCRLASRSRKSFIWLTLLVGLNIVGAAAVLLAVALLWSFVRGSSILGR